MTDEILLQPDELMDAISCLPQNVHWIPTVDELVNKYKIEENIEKYEKFIRWILASFPAKVANEELQTKIYLRKILNTRK